MKDLTTVLKKPLITEKGTMLKESENKVIFAVDKAANKIEIKEAVEKLYNVHVTDVKTMVMKGKAKRFGRHAYQRSDWKKAVITLKTGDSIAFYEGV